jgi:quercetin dioxygenase-like cupin family protein
MTYTYISKLQQLIPEIPADTIISRSLHKDDEVNATLFGFAKGQELTEHTASQPAILHFIAGKARLTLGEEEVTAEPGSWVHMPPHLPHSIVAETPLTMLLILIKSR